LKTYLENFDPELVKTAINLRIYSPGQQIPVPFYAVERNDPELVRLLVDVGANVDLATHPAFIPVLAFAILHAKNDCINTLEVVKTLLARGANPHAIPKDMWAKPLVKPKKFDSRANKDKDVAEKWCAIEFRLALFRTCHNATS